MIAPNLLPGRTFDQSKLNSKLLFHWRASDRSLGTVGSDSTGTLVRASAGGLTEGRGQFRPNSTSDVRLVGPAADNQPRWGVTSAHKPYLLLEAARINLLLGSTPDNTGSPWGGEEHFTLTTATAVVAGTTPYKHLNKGIGASKARGQVFGTLTNAPETLSFIVENVDANNTAIGIRDDTVGNWVALINLAWSTGAISVASSAVGTNVTASAISLGTGPNGGALYRISVTATANNPGNVRRITIYPTDTPQNTKAVILHHVQHEEAPFVSSPIPTVASTVTRAAETLLFPFLAPPQELTAYVKFISGATATTVDFGILSIGRGSVFNAEIDLRMRAGSVFRAFLTDGSSGVSTSATSATAVIGDLVECLVTLTAAGVLGLQISINGGAIETATPSAALALPAAWTNQQVGINEIDGGGSIGFFRYIEVKIGSGTKTMQEMREAL